LDEALVADPASLVGEAVELQHRLIKILQSEWETQNEMIAACVREMPKSSVVFEVLDPPRGGGHPGFIHDVALDFAGASGAPADIIARRLRDLEPVISQV
jgi:hypothetical protein